MLLSKCLKRFGGEDVVIFSHLHYPLFFFTPAKGLLSEIWSRIRNGDLEVRHFKTGWKRSLTVQEGTTKRF